LRIPQFLIGVLLSGYRSANLRFAPRIGRTASPSDLPAARAACSSPAPPSSSTSDSHLPLDPLASLPIDPQLAPSTDLSAQPSGRSSTRVSDLSFQLRLPIDPQPSPPVDLPACLPTHLQLAPSANPPAQPFRSRPARAFRQRSGSALKPNLRLSSFAVFAWRCPLAHLRPSPLINLPALPATTTSESHRSLHPLGFCATHLRLAPPIDLPVACGSNLRLLGCCAPSALPSG